MDVLDRHRLDENENEITVMRYRMHPLMRQYAAAKAGEITMQSNRRRAAYLFLYYAEQMESYDALESEHENIMSGADWAYNAQEWELVKRFTWAVDSYLGTRGYWKERRLLLEQAIKATKKLGDKSGVFKRWARWAMMAHATGDLAEARRLYQESLKIDQELGNKSGVFQVIAPDGNDGSRHRRSRRGPEAVPGEPQDRAGAGGQKWRGFNVAPDGNDGSRHRRSRRGTEAVPGESQDQAGAGKQKWRGHHVAPDGNDGSRHRRSRRGTEAVPGESEDPAGAGRQKWRGHSLGQLGTIHKRERLSSSHNAWLIAYSTFEEMKSPNKDIGLDGY